MPVQVSCPSCNQMLRVPDTAIGKSVRCPKCQQVFPAQQPASPPAPSAPDPFNFGPNASSPKPDPFAGLGSTSSQPTAKDPFAGIGPAPSKPAASPFDDFSSFKSNASPPASNPYDTNPYAAPSAAYAPQTSGTLNYLPWETHGASFENFVSTIKLIMFEPQHAFTVMQRDGDFSKSLTFAISGMIVGILGSILWQIPFQLFQLMAIGGGKQVGILLVGIIITTLVQSVIAFIISIVTLFLFGTIMHLFLMLTGAARRDLMVTLRVMCWTTGAFGWLQLIPFLGPLVAVFWQLVANVIGLASAHETTIGKVVLAIVLEIVLCLVLIVGVGAAFFALIAGIAAGN